MNSRQGAASKALHPGEYVINPQTAQSSLLAALFLAFSTPVAAQQIEPAAGDPPAERPSVSGSLGVGVGAARLAEDWFLVLTPSFYLQIDGVAITRESELFDAPQIHPLRFLFEAPLYVRVSDRAPVDGGSRFRRELWDEPAEYARVLRWVEYASPYDGIYFRGGELPNVRIGHRTIVDSYDNTLDADHYQWGVHHNLNTRFGGVETFVDNVTDPDAMALRLYARPWAFMNPESALRRLAFGSTIAGDQNAPRQLALTSEGTYESTQNGDLIVEEGQATGILGWDVEMQMVATERVSITPYTDVNTHFGAGTGWHLGSFFGFQLTDTIVLDMRAEYRLLGGQYEPAYIGRTYEIERLSYLPIRGAVAAVPKLEFVLNQEERRRNGYYAELGFNFAELVYIAAGWEDQTGVDNNSAWAQLRVPALSVVQFGAYYVNTRFEGASGLFDLDNALAVAEARVSPIPWLYVDGQVRRRWEVDGSGAYTPVNDWSVGAGVNFGF